MNNKITRILIITILAVFVVFLAVQSFNSLKGLKDKDATVRINADAYVFAIPDTVTLSFTVKKTNDDVNRAKDEMKVAVKTILDNLKQFDIDEKQIKTVSYNIYPRYEWMPNDGRKFKGYVASQSFEVFLDNMEIANSVVDALTSWGATTVGSPRFEVKDKDYYKSLAREKAIQKAKEKARDLEKQLGVKFGDIVGFSESYPNEGPIYFRNAMAADLPEEDQITLMSGENKIVSQVTLIYNLK